jgi:sugar lactone lactonase YvrE
MPVAEEMPEGGEATAGEMPEMVPIPVQSVPTTVRVGPDDAYYVGELSGGPFPVGGASVWRVAPGEEPAEYATGFTNIMGLDFAPDGTLYVAEMAHEGLMATFAGGAPPVGAVMAVAPGGGEPVMVATGEQLMALGGLAVDDDGAIYVSTNTIMPGAGALVKITP